MARGANYILRVFVETQASLSKERTEALLDALKRSTATDTRQKLASSRTSDLNPKVSAFDLVIDLFHMYRHNVDSCGIDRHTDLLLPVMTAVIGAE